MHVLRVRIIHKKSQRALLFVSIAFLLACVLFQGCASVELGGVFQQVETIPEGQALVYIYRPHMPYEYAVVFDIEVDDVPLIGIADASYYPWVTAPGLVTSSASGGGSRPPTCH